MRKAYAVADFLSDDNKRRMKEAAADAGFELAFYENPEEAEGNVSDGEILYSGANAGICGKMPELKWCHTAFAGVGSYTATGLFDSGDILLSNSSGAYGRAISEYIVMVSLLLLRDMPSYNKMMAAHEWSQGYAVRSVAGSNIVIIGTGDIGTAAAGKYKALGAGSVIGFNRSGKNAEGFDRVYALSELDDLLKDEDFAGRMDILVLCVPGTEESRGLLSKDRIDRLPKKAYVINVGRGIVMDQDALLDALNQGRIAGAALDVVYPEPLPKDHPLWTAPNCIITPHMSGDMGLPYTVDKTVEFFCENLKRFAEGEELLNLVDVKKGY